MPARHPVITQTSVDQIVLLGRQIRAHRKALRISMAAVAEVAGMSRVTLHRIENGEPSVTMGAYLNTIAALGLDIGIIAPANKAPEVPDADRAGWIPARIRLGDYPQLKQIAWQVHGTDALTPVEALSIYERNWRHVDVAALETRERQLIDALRLGLGDHGHV